MKPPEHFGDDSCPFNHDIIQKPLPDDLGCLLVVVGGFPRTSTNFVYNTLKGLGQLVGHEWVFNPQGVEVVQMKKIEVDISGFAQNYLAALKERGVKLVHLVRDPVDTINSTLNYFDYHFPEGHKREYWDWMAECWYWWNLAWHGRADDIVYIENHDHAIRTVMKHIGKLTTWEQRRLAFAQARIESKANRGDPSKGVIGTWEDLPQHVQGLALDLGAVPSDRRMT